MSVEKIHVYFVPGLAAGKEIFRNISFLKDHFEIHILEWLIPEPRETIASYAKRMAERITEKDAVLVGVSFGGVVVQEMSCFVKLRKLIIVSSVKSRDELPRRLKVARATGLYKLLPTSIVIRSKDLRRFAVGPRSRKRLGLYNEYLHVRDKRYLDWAIKNMVCWDRTETVPSLHHIHGDADIVFPIHHIESPEIISGGTHVMILFKAKEVSEKIKSIILE